MQQQMSQTPQDIDSQLVQALSLDRPRWHDAWETRMVYHRADIRFDRPSRTLPISLTGAQCALNCAHCGGHYLQHMYPIWNVRANGATSCLISGGCDAKGRVPVMRHLNTVAKLREGRRLNWHVGFADETDICAISPYADVISCDIVGDQETVRQVYGLDLTPSDYLQSFEMLRRYARAVPHITIGLLGGQLSGERAALAGLQPLNVEQLVFIVFIPTNGTAYEGCQPPRLAEVADLLLDARLMLPNTRLYLGCMRPWGAYRQAVDELAVEAGLNGIVNPTRAAERAARERSLSVVWGNECCALD